MDHNRLSIRLGLGLLVMVMSLLVTAISHGSAGDRGATEVGTAHTGWEYAELEYRGTLSEKRTHHAWQWISSEEGLEAFQGSSDIATIRDLCHAISKEPVDFQSSEARNTHIMLLDTIGRKGWEMVDHFQAVKDLPLDARADTDRQQSLGVSVVWRWSFKRPR